LVEDIIDTDREGYHSATWDWDCVSWEFHTCVKSLIGWHLILNFSTMSSVTLMVSSGPVCVSNVTSKMVQRQQ
jgi:hypothetical protein